MNDIIQPLMPHLKLAAAGAGDVVLKNVGESDFNSPFWSWFIIAIVVFGFLFCIVLLLTQLKARTNKAHECHVQPHEWDETLQEFNNPLPRWWVWMFVITLVFSALYLWMYPGLGSYKGNMGLIDPAYKNGWTEQKQYDIEKAKLDATSQPLFDKFGAMSVVDLAKDKQAMQVGQRLFLNNCAQCHGSDARGGSGFPNLADNDWLYGGYPDAIVQTLTTGRHGIMPAHGEILGGAQGVNDAVNYVLSLSNSAHDAVSAARGKEKFAICAACHTAAGTGSLSDQTGALAATGAPNLTDKIWLYGGDTKTLTETITKGRANNVMPSWDCLLGQSRIHVLAAYVWQLNRDDTTSEPKNPTAAPDFLAAGAAANKAALTQARADAKAKGESECLAVSVVK